MDELPTSCRKRHIQTSFYRRTMEDGRFHIIERCGKCGANARGPGVWVPQYELDSILVRQLKEDQQAGNQDSKQLELLP